MADTDEWDELDATEPSYETVDLVLQAYARRNKYWKYDGDSAVEKTMRALSDRENWRN